MYNLIICFTAVAAYTESNRTQIVDLQRQTHRTTQNVNQLANSVLGLFEDFEFHQVMREFN